MPNRHRSTLRGKIRSFASKRSGQEYLYQDPRTSFPGPGYSQHDISGMDDCFPTVSACTYPHGRREGLPLADHGWLWNRRWTSKSSVDWHTAAVELTEEQFRFERTCRLVGPGQLQLEYALANLGDEAFEFVYANHLLLYADITTRIEYPAEMKKAYVYSTTYLEIPSETWIDWPPHQRDITEPFDSTRGTQIKLFSPRLTRGEASISHGDKRESLRIEFDGDQLPYLGVLLSQGFSPTERNWRGMFVALEATTGIGDELASCRATNSTDQLEAGEIRRFQIKLSLAKRMR